MNATATQPRKAADVKPRRPEQYPEYAAALGKFNALREKRDELLAKFRAAPDVPIVKPAKPENLIVAAARQLVGLGPTEDAPRPLAQSERAAIERELSIVQEAIRLQQGVVSEADRRARRWAYATTEAEHAGLVASMIDHLEQARALLQEALEIENAYGAASRRMAWDACRSLRQGLLAMNPDELRAAQRARGFKL